MYNNLINIPLAIDSFYLKSLIPTLLIDFKQGNFKSSADIEADVMQHLENQATSATANGADKFPVILNITFPIVKYSTWRFLGTSTIANIVKRIERDERVSGILFNIDSGGGMVSGTAELCRTIKECSLPTIAYTNGYMCSAAMWIGGACDARVAHPDADLIGSIGTMMSFQDYSAMFEKWGATIYELYAPQSTEKNKEFRDLMKGDEKAYTSRLEGITDKFIATMKEYLGSKLKDDGKVFKGKTYTPEEALKIGLIDSIGTLEEALSNF